MRDKEVVERSRGDEMKKSKWSKSSSGICDPLHQASLPTSSSSRSKLRDETVSEIAEQAAACSRDEHQKYQKSHLSLPGSEKLLVQSKDGEDTEHLKTGTSTTSSSFPTSPLLHVSANQPATVVASSSNLVVPGLSNQRQKQEEKKKLLWGDAANKTVRKNNFV